MNENRELLASLFTTIKRFRKNKECKETIKALRKQIRLLTPIDSFPDNKNKYYTSSGIRQTFRTGNMQEPVALWVYPRDCWTENVLDVINHRCNTLYSKSEYFRDFNNQYYLKSKYFMLYNKVYSKDKFTLYNNLAVPNNKIYPLGVFYNSCNEKEMYITARENEEFIPVNKFLELYPNKQIFGLSVENNYTKCFKVIISCLLFKGKYRVTLPQNRSYFGFTKKMLLDCEFSLPEGYKDIEPICIEGYNFYVRSINYLGRRSLVDKMWGELITKRVQDFLGSRGVEKNFKSYFNNLITFAKKEAEYEK